MLCDAYQKVGRLLEERELLLREMAQYMEHCQGKLAMLRQEVLAGLNWLPMTPSVVLQLPATGRYCIPAEHRDAAFARGLQALQCASGAHYKRLVQKGLSAFGSVLDQVAAGGVAMGAPEASTPDDPDAADFADDPGAADFAS